MHFDIKGGEVMQHFGELRKEFLLDAAEFFPFSQLPLV